MQSQLETALLPARNRSARASVLTQANLLVGALMLVTGLLYLTIA